MNEGGGGGVFILELLITGRPRVSLLSLPSHGEGKRKRRNMAAFALTLLRIQLRVSY